MINSLFRRLIKFLISIVFIFSFSWSSNLFCKYFTGDSFKSLQGFTLCFQLLFLFVILLLPVFFIKVLLGGSSRISFILQLSSRFPSKLRSAKLYSQIKMVFNTCLVLRSFIFLHLAIRSAILSTVSLEVVLCHS